MEKNGWEEIVMERLSAGRWRQTVHTISMGHFILLEKDKKIRILKKIRKNLFLLNKTKKVKVKNEEKKTN